VVVITGGSSGIGRAIACALGGRRAALWLVARNAGALEDVAASLRAHGTQVTCCIADLGRPDDVRSLTERLEREAATVDVLVHSAGAHAMGPLASAPVEQLDAQYQVNVRAPYVLTQALLPKLRAARGQIVFINSSAGLVASPNAGQYAASKFALKAIADSLRAEVNRDGIRVLTVYPGRTASPMQAAIHEAEGKPYHSDLLAQPEDIAALVISALALPPTAEVTDLCVRPMRKT
jgi:short-subunit dehydrogenase